MGIGSAVVPAAPLGGSKRADGHAQAALGIDQAERLAEIAERVADLGRALEESNRRVKRLEADLEDVRWRLHQRESRRLRARFEPRLFMLRQYPPHPVWSSRRLPPAQVAMPSSLSVAIVTPVFNQAKWIRQAIESVLAQDCQRLEYVVQDGGSSDGTAEIIECYRGELAACESRPDGGQTAAINRGFAKTSAEIMAWLNGDDFLLPGALAYVARFFVDHPEVDLIYGHRLVVDQDGRQVGHWILPPHDPEALKWADYVPQETMFWRRRAWEAIGPLDESFKFAMDWDFLLRVQAKGLRIHRVPCFLGCFRVHDEQKTATQHDVYDAEAKRLRMRSLGKVASNAEVMRALRPYLRRHVIFERAFKLKIVRY